jgi:hypothetical protein
MISGDHREISVSLEAKIARKNAKLCPLKRCFASGKYPEVGVAYLIGREHCLLDLCPSEASKAQIAAFHSYIRKDGE